MARGMTPDNRGLVKAAAAARRDGNLERATRMARTALDITPNNVAATRELIRILHVTSTTPIDLREARDLLDERLGSPNPRPVDLGLAIDHAISRVLLDANQEQTIEILVGLQARFPALAVGPIRRFTSFLVDRGEAELAGDILENLASSSDGLAHLTTLHNLRVRQQRFDDAGAIVARIESTYDSDDSTPSLLQADASLAIRDSEGARLALSTIRPKFERAHSMRLVTTWRLEGQHAQIISHLRVNRSGYSPYERAHILFDSYWALGDRGQASLALSAVNGADRHEPAHIDKVQKLEGSDIAAELRETALGLTIDQLDDDASVLRAIRLLADSNRPQAIVDLTEQAARGTSLGPSNRYNRARALYSLRRFEEATEILATLDGTNHTWTSAKLRARILLEQGRFSEAEQNRRSSQRPNDGHDEAFYHALLAQRRWSEAFAMDPIKAQFQALEIVLPSTAERRPDGFVRHRFIIADAGPGDEIQDASLLGELAGMSDQLTVSCDPRLHSMFSRSMPQIDFIPSRRVRPEDFGCFAPEAPTRDPNPLCELLTTDALAVARTADRVALGRSMKSARDLSAGPTPVPAYLHPSSESQNRFSTVLPTDEPVIGIVWRSELRDMMRDIHYLQASDLGPFFSLGARVVVLQHDVDSEERGVLSELAGSLVVDLDGLDLRNDIEALAGLLSHLDLVVGIGTTTTNLAAALGVPTLMMQPTHFGSWLAHGPKNTSFWYESCEIVVADPPYDRSQLVQMTTRRAREILDDGS